VAQADDAIGDPKWQRYGNEYRDIRTHEALPATLTERKLIWHQLKSGRRRSSRIWKTHTIYCMQPPSALFISSPHSSRLNHLSTIRKPLSQGLKRTINSIQYISVSVIHSNNWSSTRLFANCIVNEKFTKNNTFANDNTLPTTIQQQKTIPHQQQTPK
jgi:hypothetical protein